VPEQTAARWPANLILSYPEDQIGPDGQPLPNPAKDEVVGLFPQTSGGAWPAKGARFGMSGGNRKQLGERTEMTDSGSAARFFYTAKASGEDRGNHTKSALPLFGVGEESWRNPHPTVKPIALMRYLVRLVTRPGGIVLDPFMGSGSTGIAALREGFNFIGIERDPAHFQTACERIEACKSQRP